MKNLVFTVSLIFSCIAFAGKEGGGGGGIVVNGEYLTLGDAQTPIPEDKIVSPPEAAELYEQIKKTLIAKVNASQPRSEFYPIRDFYRAIMPMGGRQYIHVPTNEIDKNFLTKLKQIYAGITKKPITDIVVYGFTVGKKTYLTDEFFALRTAVRKMAVLFHESLWIINPDLTYEFVVSAEILFQRLLEKNLLPNIGLNDYHEKFYRKIGNLFNAQYIPVQIAAISDYENKRLSGDQVQTGILFPYTDPGNVFYFDIKAKGKKRSAKIALDLPVADKNIVKKIYVFPNLAVLQELSYQLHRPEGRPGISIKINLVSSYNTNNRRLVDYCEGQLPSLKHVLERLQWGGVMYWPSYFDGGFNYSLRSLETTITTDPYARCVDSADIVFE